MYFQGIGPRYQPSAAPLWWGADEKEKRGLNEFPEMSLDFNEMEQKMRSSPEEVEMEGEKVEEVQEGDVEVEVEEGADEYKYDEDDFTEKEMKDIIEYSKNRVRAELQHKYSKDGEESFFEVDGDPSFFGPLKNSQSSENK
eukprot:TRINITY_DN8239_c0_g1_i1.p1 TRINITY_DN8239_c0_g1~~TRINITY_DN8239_c0_g1_i1.p1  ORF type:complete len:141 (-),score=55.12 TRINITY_DN8239_c0_g1_i1:74-496(-)